MFALSLAILFFVFDHLIGLNSIPQYLHSLGFALAAFFAQSLQQYFVFFTDLALNKTPQYKQLLLDLFNAKTVLYFNEHALLQNFLLPPDLLYNLRSILLLQHKHKGTIFLSISFSYNDDGSGKR